MVDEGYAQGQKELKELKEIAYDCGFKGESKTAPEKFKHAQNIFNEYYENGVVDKKKRERKIALDKEHKKQMEMALFIGAGVIILVPATLILKRESNKNKIENQLGEDDIVA